MKLTDEQKEAINLEEVKKVFPDGLIPTVGRTSDGGYAANKDIFLKLCAIEDATEARIRSLEEAENES